MSEYWHAVRLFQPSLRRMFVGLALVIMVSFGLQAVLFNLYLLRLGFDVRYVGLLGGVGQLVWAAVAIPAGMLSVRFGLRNSLQVGMALIGLGLAVTLWVATLPRVLWSAGMFGGIAVLNIGLAFATVNMPPYVMAVTGERERKHAFAVVSAIIPAAGFTGSMLAGVLPGMLARTLGMSLQDPGPYWLTLWLGPILCALGLLPLIGVDPGRPVAVSDGADGRSAPLGLFAFWYVIVFLVSIGESSVRTFYNVYLDTTYQAGPALIGTVIGMAQLLPIAVALLLPLLMLRWGTGHTLVGGITALAGGLGTLAIAAGLGVAVAAYVAIIACTTVAGASRDLFGQEMVIPRWRTSSQGVAMVGLALGGFTAGVAGGALIEAFGFGTLYMVGALACLLAAGLMLLHLRGVPAKRSVTTG